jgi:2-polyprenyl-3-methyl-5-hydroxy-6-metoxy-1,4-benzoquinol methylase
MDITQPTPSTSVTSKRLLEFGFGFAPALIIDAAVKYYIFDALDHGPKTLKEIHYATGASKRGLSAVLNALVALELLQKDSEGFYSLTPESAAFLVRSQPNYQGGLFHHVSSQLIPNWLHLSEVLGTGRPVVAVDSEKEAAFFQQFVEDLFGFNHAAAQALADILEISKASELISVLDIAAGSGVWGIALAQRSYMVRVQAVDFANILPITRKIAARHGVQEQFTYTEGDLATADFGSGHHVALLGHILHSQGMSECRALIRKTYEALTPGATIVIADWLTNSERTAPVFPLLFAVNMLVHTKDEDTFSFEEIRSWLEESGFNQVSLVNVPAVSPLILATKPAH